MLVISGTTTVNYTNDGGIPPSSPASTSTIRRRSSGWSPIAAAAPMSVASTWSDESRETETLGGRFALTWGDDKLNLKMGGCVRRSVARHPSAGNDAAVAGRGLRWQSEHLRAGAERTATVPWRARRRDRPGRTAIAAAAGTAQALSVSDLRCLRRLAHSERSVPSYLRPTQYGFVTVDWDAFARDSNYDAVHDADRRIRRHADDGELGFDHPRR